MPSLLLMQDFVSTTSTVTSLADHFAAMNDEVLGDTDLSIEARLESDVVISLSHYVPRMVRTQGPYRRSIHICSPFGKLSKLTLFMRTGLWQELVPEKRFLIEPSLTKVSRPSRMRQLLQGIPLKGFGLLNFCAGDWLRPVGKTGAAAGASAACLRAHAHPNRHERRG